MPLNLHRRRDISILIDIYKNKSTRNMINKLNYINVIKILKNDIEFIQSNCKYNIKFNKKYYKYNVELYQICMKMRENKKCIKSKKFYIQYLFIYHLCELCKLLSMYSY